MPRGKELITIEREDYFGVNQKLPWTSDSMDKDDKILTL